MPLTACLPEGTNPGAASLTDAYTVPASNIFEGIVVVTNRAAVATAFRVSIALAGAADAPTHYIAYDVAIAGNATVDTSRFTAPAGAVIRVYATLATLTFRPTGYLKS